MNWRAECAAVIPCLNEASSIERIVARVRRHLPAVWVVDDGSSDDTGLRAESAGARVLWNPVTLGKGAALRAGWSEASTRGCSWALVLDGDGQHAPEDIPAFLSCAERNSAQLVVGNRMEDASGMPPVRRAVNRWMSGRLSRAAGRHFPDSQCGFRLVWLNALSRIGISSNHFEIESELLLGFARAGLRIEFVPIRALYGMERSKIHPLTDTVRWLRWWWGVRARPARERREALSAIPRPGL